MQGFLTNIEQKTKDNNYFRQVLYTAKHHQLVVMTLQAGEEIGEEVHQLDQFFRFEEGEGKCVLDGVEHPLKDGDVLIVPEGTRHNIINTGAGPLRLYTIYAPPNHADGTIYKTKAEAESAKGQEHFDGKTTE